MTSAADLLPVAFEAVDLASSLLRNTAPGRVTVKGDRDFASETDYLIEHEVCNLLQERLPEAGFVGEEDGKINGQAEMLWALDPVDGTANYIHGSPLCAVSLALILRDRPVLGVIDLPFLGERYWATEGGGAFADGRPIRTSGTTRLQDAVVALGDYAVGHDAERRNRLRLTATGRLASTVQRVRMHGSAAVDLAWLATGRVDATVTMSNKLWDMSAGVIIVREAGGAVVDKDGTGHAPSSTTTIGVNGPLLSDLLVLLQQAWEEVPRGEV